MLDQVRARFLYRSDSFTIRHRTLKVQWFSVHLVLWITKTESVICLAQLMCARLIKSVSLMRVDLFGLMIPCPLED